MLKQEKISRLNILSSASSIMPHVALASIVLGPYLSNSVHMVHQQIPLYYKTSNRSMQWLANLEPPV